MSADAGIEAGLAGKTLLVTGSTGFLGKSVVEKCLRSLPGIGRINLGIRSSTRRSAAHRLVRAIVESGGRPHLVHVSTAYVGGMLRGLVREELPFDPGLNWRHEAEVLSTLRPAVEEESRRPEVLEKLARQARSRLGPAGTPSQARAVERLRQRWVRDRLVERGRAPARAMGLTDIHSFTKAMAERAVVELAGELPLSIVRPSIIESSLAEPFPGWLEGFRMAEPIILAFARAALQDFSGLPDSLLDVIPADLVVNAVLAVASSPPEPGEHRIYHAASGSRNPLRLRGLYEQSRVYFDAHPLRDRW